MADPKGFLKFGRVEAEDREPSERVHDWNEIHPESIGRTLLPVITEQAARCMDCGIPFCHQGCPLGNIIPEWNDLVWRGDWDEASERLHATNNFPEFTGRICPAPCETACVLGINQDPVTIKNVEVTIIDQAWDRGHVKPQPPEWLSGKTVAVIGSGPAGLTVAQQLTRAGHTVAVYERDDKPGGLMRYGVPEYKMEKKHIDRRIDQMRREGTIFRTGVEVGWSVTAEDLRDRYDAIVLTIGAPVPRELGLPGRQLKGIHQAMTYLPQGNRAALGEEVADQITAEGKHVIIIGGGDTGADCLGTALRQGAKSVTTLAHNAAPGLERSASDPWPTYPKVLRVSSVDEEGGVREYAVETREFLSDGHGHVRALRVLDKSTGSEQEIPADLVLLSTGFTGAQREGIATQFGVDFDVRGTIARDDTFMTSVDGVFVAGDAGRGASLVVWAIAEGRSCAAAVDSYLTGESSTLAAPVRPTDQPLTV